MMHTDWLEVEWNDEELERENTIRGMKVKLYVSPYDTPYMLRGKYDEQNRCIVIELRYEGDSDEPVEDVPYAGDSGVTYQLGRYSRRLYGLKISADKLQERNTNWIDFQVIRPIDYLIQRAGRIGRQSEPQLTDSYELAKTAISRKRKELQQLAFAW